MPPKVTTIWGLITSKEAFKQSAFFVAMMLVLLGTYQVVSDAMNRMEKMTREQTAMAISSCEKQQELQRAHDKEQSERQLAEFHEANERNAKIMETLLGKIGRDVQAVNHPQPGLGKPAASAVAKEGGQ